MKPSALEEARTAAGGTTRTTLPEANDQCNSPTDMLACASRGIVLGFHKSTRDPYGNVNGSHCDLCQRTITVDDWNAAMGLR